jgi:hypothetical protein
LKGDREEKEIDTPPAAFAPENFIIRITPATPPTQAESDRAPSPKHLSAENILPKRHKIGDRKKYEEMIETRRRLQETEDSIQAIIKVAPFGLVASGVLYYAGQMVGNYVAGMMGVVDEESKANCERAGSVVGVGIGVVVSQFVAEKLSKRIKEEPKRNS